MNVGHSLRILLPSLNFEAAKGMIFLCIANMWREESELENYLVRQ